MDASDCGQTWEGVLDRITEAKAGGEAVPGAAGAAQAAELLLIEHFTPHVGKVFRFKGTRHALLLDHIVSDDRELPDWVRRRPFTLIFRGPKQRDVLPEGSYQCEIDGGPSFSLHVSPILTPQPDRQHYQAVFN